MAVTTSLTTRIEAFVKWTFKNDAEISDVIDQYKQSYAQSLADGTGDAQADMVWHDKATLAASGATDYDLNALTTTLFGQTHTVNFAVIKVIYIKNLSTEKILRVGGNGGTNEWSIMFNSDDSAVIDVSPGGVLLNVNPSASGWAVTDTSSDVLRVENTSSTGSLTYEIALVGETN